MTPTPTPNVSELALAAEVSRRQVRRDLENGAPPDPRAYLAWRRKRQADPRSGFDYALARGVDAWNGYRHQRRRYTDRAALTELRAEIMKRVREAVENIAKHWPSTLARIQPAEATALVREDITNTLYDVAMGAFYALQARTPDAPENLQRPAEGSLAGVRAWIREAQSARVHLRSDIRDGSLIPIEELVDDARHATVEMRLALTGVAGRIAGAARTSPKKLKEVIDESLAYAFERAERHLLRLERRKRA